jgi:hypothetical protein
MSISRYLAQLCNQTFRQKGHLNNHKRMHTTCATYMKRHDIILSFACQHCNKTFRQNIDLYNTRECILERSTTCATYMKRQIIFIEKISLSVNIATTNSDQTLICITREYILERSSTCATYMKRHGIIFIVEKSFACQH